MHGLIPALGRTFMRAGCFIFGDKAAQLYMGQALMESGAMQSVVMATMVVTCEGEGEGDEESDEDDVLGWADDAAKGKGRA